MERTEMEQAQNELYGLFARITDAGDFEKLLEDLCTYTEVEQLSQRLLCAKLLLKGYTYNKIIELTDISSATLSRVSRCLRHGSGGYREILGKYGEEEDGK
ncbi:MAG TPA: TrpR-related protein YerC/YecD [Candidatus Coproplasma avistercoris]|nr:TrpR-related protein YerC/YecD [Candidatus Coproplasma avistercoris]